jgi:hypothetical protein
VARNAITDTTREHMMVRLLTTHRLKQRDGQGVRGGEDFDAKYPAVEIKVEDDLSGKPIVLDNHLRYSFARTDRPAR